MGKGGLYSSARGRAEGRRCQEFLEIRAQNSFSLKQDVFKLDQHVIIFLGLIFDINGRGKKGGVAG